MGEWNNAVLLLVDLYMKFLLRLKQPLPPQLPEHPLLRARAVATPLSTRVEIIKLAFGFPSFNITKSKF